MNSGLNAVGSKQDVSNFLGRFVVNAVIMDWVNFFEWKVYFKAVFYSLTAKPLP